MPEYDCSTEVDGKVVSGMVTTRHLIAGNQFAANCYVASCTLGDGTIIITSGNSEKEALDKLKTGKPKITLNG